MNAYKNIPDDPWFELKDWHDAHLALLKAEDIVEVDELIEAAERAEEGELPW